MDIVELGKVKKSIRRKLPLHIEKKLQRWVRHIQAEGLSNMKKEKGWHDEPLKGKRRGQRSARLSRHYRVIYKVEKASKDNLVIVLEINKHEY